MERLIRIEMQHRWKAVQERFIEMCGGDMTAMQVRASERKVMEAPLVAEYHARTTEAA